MKPVKPTSPFGHTVPPSKAMSVRESFEHAVQMQGWNEESQVTVLLEFLNMYASRERFEKYLLERIKIENKPSTE